MRVQGFRVFGFTVFIGLTGFTTLIGFIGFRGLRVSILGRGVAEGCSGDGYDCILPYCTVNLVFSCNKTCE